jgi:hypothetical protein
MDLRTLIDKMVREGAIAGITTNNRAQFGTKARVMHGARLLPERLVTENAYREEGVKFKTYAAVPSTRYSPVTLFDGALTSSFLVELGESDYGTELTAKAFDALRRSLSTSSLEQAASQLLSFVDNANTALLLRNEIWRWQAIVGSQIDAKHGNVQFTVDFANPSGHRVTVPSGTVASKQGWHLSSYDPIPDILAMIQLLKDKGYIVDEIFMSSAIFILLQKNPKAREYMNSVVAIASVGGTGITTNNNSRQLTKSQLEGVIRENAGIDLARGITLNDEQYNTRNGTKRFMPRDAVVFVATTGREEDYPSYTSEDTEPLIVQDTLGYVGIGTAGGEDSPGRVIQMEPILKKKPPRIELEAWQTSGPVILEPEAIGVIRIPDPTP